MAKEHEDQRGARRRVLHGVLTAVAAALLQGGAVPATAADARLEQRERLAASRALAASPTDQQLAGASDAELVDLAVRCVPMEGMTYCLHHGWDEMGRNSSVLLAARSDQVEQDSEDMGDMSLPHALRLWAAQPYDDRLAGERRELAEARAAAGKVVLFHRVITGARLPSDFAIRHPDLVLLATRIEADLAALTSPAPETWSPTPESTGSACDDFSKYDCAHLMSDSRLQKQSTSYYCGPTSLQGLVWNDPKAPYYKSQSYWAGILHTDTNGSTWIYDLKNAINTYTHWDDSDYAGGPYAVHDISTWTDSMYRSLFRSHTKTARSPIQLHPKLIQGQTTTYYQGTTSGHFNVGRGYDFTIGDYIYLHEPAGASGAYPPVAAWEITPMIRKAQYANSNQRNIAY